MIEILAGMKYLTRLFLRWFDQTHGARICEEEVMLLSPFNAIKQVKVYEIEVSWQGSSERKESYGFHLRRR